MQPAVACCALHARPSQQSWRLLQAAHNTSGEPTPEVYSDMHGYRHWCYRHQNPVISRAYACMFICCQA